MSRRKGASAGQVLTGGTRDYKPNFLTINLGDSAGADDYQVQQVTLPIIRPRSEKDTEVTVMELLWVDYYDGLSDALADGTEVQASYLAPVAFRSTSDTCTIATLQTDLSDRRVIAPSVWAGLVVTSGSFARKWPRHVNLMDGFGNGVVYPTDQIVYHHGEVSNTNHGVGSCKIAYRWTNIGVWEFVSQAQSNAGS